MRAVSGRLVGTGPGGGASRATCRGSREVSCCCKDPTARERNEEVGSNSSIDDDAPLRNLILRNLSDVRVLGAERDRPDSQPEGRLAHKRKERSPVGQASTQMMPVKGLVSPMSYGGILRTVVLEGSVLMPFAFTKTRNVVGRLVRGCYRNNDLPSYARDSAMA